MTDRRFSEEEVAAIFKRATETQQTPQRQLPSGEGLTLAELQEIGGQVGIPPEQMSRAAASLVQAGTPTSRTFLGLTVSVGRTIELDHKMTEDEWDRLVVDLRETFDSRGTVRQEGSFRQWTVGNLQVLLEPTPTGQRIRMRTMKGSAQAWMLGGVFMSAMAAIVALSATLNHTPNKLGVAATFAIIAAGQFAVAALQLPGWARLRKKQMEEIAQRLATASDSPSRTPALRTQHPGTES